jgi:hypothetical protein
MASGYAVNRIESPAQRRRSVRTGWFRDLKIDGALPVLRRAKLAKHSPLLKKRQTKKAAEILKSLWPEWQHEYIAKVAQIAGVNARDLAVPGNEKVRYRFDGDTPMIDLPRIRTTNGSSYQFDQRNCVALCVERYSSKIWTRIGLPENSSGCDVKDVRALTKRYRRQADETTEWFYEEFFRLTADAFKGTKRIPDKAVLEVTTLGLRVNSDFTPDEFDAWMFTGDTPNLANETLRELIAAAADVNFDIAEVEEREEEAYWLPVPTAVNARTHKVMPRRVLYLSRTVGDVVQFVGVGLDDSRFGELAHDVGLKLSRIIAGWV